MRHSLSFFGNVIFDRVTRNLETVEREPVTSDTTRLYMQEASDKFQRMHLVTHGRHVVHIARDIRLRKQTRL